MQLYPAVLLVGLTLFVGGLFSKGWGIYTFNRNRGALTKTVKTTLLHMHSSNAKTCNHELLLVSGTTRGMEAQCVDVVPGLGGGWSLPRLVHCLHS